LIALIGPLILKHPAPRLSPEIKKCLKKVAHGHPLNLCEDFDWDTINELLLPGISKQVRLLEPKPSNERHFPIVE
jgi:hypothetical protein